jgi:small subunit ribosomal protein S5
VKEPVKLSDQKEQPFEETVVKVYRCAKVVKGGRRFSFAALVVLGDRAGTVGIGYGKANEVPLAVEKGIKDARKSLHRIALLDRTIPHQISGKYGATKIIWNSPECRMSLQRCMGVDQPKTWSRLR